MYKIDVFFLLYDFYRKILCHHMLLNDRRFMMVLNFVIVKEDRDQLLLVTIVWEKDKTTTAPCVPSIQGTRHGRYSRLLTNVLTDASSVACAATRYTSSSVSFSPSHKVSPPLSPNAPNVGSHKTSEPLGIIRCRRDLCLEEVNDLGRSVSSVCVAFAYKSRSSLQKYVSILIGVRWQNKRKIYFHASLPR